MMTDPIADMLTRIRNAVRIERPLVDMPTSNLRRGVAQVLKDEGYIWDFEELETVPAKTLRLHMTARGNDLRYDTGGGKSSTGSADAKCTPVSAYHAKAKSGA